MKIQKLNDSSWKLNDTDVMMRHQQDFKDFLLSHKDALASIAQKVLPHMNKFPSGSQKDFEAVCDAGNFVKVSIEKMQTENGEEFLCLGKAFLRIVSLVKVVVYVNSLILFGEDEKNYPLVAFILYHCKQALYTTEEDWVEYQNYVNHMMALKSIIVPTAEAVMKLQQMPRGKKLPKVPVLFLNNPRNYIDIDKQSFSERIVYGMSKIVKIENSSNILVEFFGIVMVNPFDVDFIAVQKAIAAQGGYAANVELKIGHKMYSFKAIAESVDEQGSTTLRLVSKQIEIAQNETLTDVVVKLMD